MNAKGNPFVHLELNTPDAAKAKEFYTKMFGWEFADNDMGPAGVYSTFKPASGPGGGGERRAPIPHLPCLLVRGRRLRPSARRAAPHRGGVGEGGNLGAGCT